MRPPPHPPNPTLPTHSNGRRPLPSDHSRSLWTMTTTEHYFRRAPCRLRTDFHLQKLIKTFTYIRYSTTVYIVYHVVSLCIKSFSFAEQSTRTVRTTIHIFIISLYVLPVLNRIHHPQATSSGVQYRVPYCTGYRMLYRVCIKK